MTSGHQVNLGVGPTTHRTVTAEDGMTTKTYTEVVTRAQNCADRWNLPRLPSAAALVLNQARM